MNLEDRFGKQKIAITMTGEEWFALLCRVVGRDLSAKGARIYSQAATKMQQQLTEASKRARGEA